MLVKYCEGHPLALKLLGRSLQKRDVAYWEECIKGLKKEPHFDIKNVLEMSFDSLPFKNDQDLFNHIACFFVGTDRDVTQTILNACDINTTSGITNLIDRCLLSIGWNNKLVMHQLVQQIGRDLVRQESPDKPWERSRLWCHEESFTVLEKKKLLIGSSSKDKRLLGSLKILDLSFCERLHSIGGFLELPTLEKLIVRNCISLVEVCESIEQCVELIHIDMSFSYKLKRVPISIGKLKKVKTLLLNGCNASESQIKMWGSFRSSLTSSNSIIKAIPNDLRFFMHSLPRSLRILSLENNNLSNESFPGDFSCLSMLEELCLNGNPIVSMPGCLRSLPRLQILCMKNCKMLMSIEHPPLTLRKLLIETYKKNYMISPREIKFDPKMSPIDLMAQCNTFLDQPIETGGMLQIQSHPSIEMDGILKIQVMAGVEKKVLHSLGWTNLEFIKEMQFGTSNDTTSYASTPTQMYYEFGIFSTIYEGKEMPKWITCRSESPSISFTVLSSPTKLRGLNFCCVETDTHNSIELPIIKISNITNNHTWIYDHYIDYAKSSGEECLNLLSHWMFGPNEMKGGDQITIIVEQKIYCGRYNKRQVTKECGVGLVYDGDGKIEDEEEEDDALGYYKSWNHIIGGDLSGFRSITGEYILSYMETLSCKEKEMGFKAFSRKEYGRPSNVFIKEIE